MDGCLTLSKCSVMHNLKHRDGLLKIRMTQNHCKSVAQKKRKNENKQANEQINKQTREPFVVLNDCNQLLKKENEREREKKKKKRKKKKASEQGQNENLPPESAFEFCS